MILLHIEMAKISGYMLSIFFSSKIHYNFYRLFYTYFINNLFAHLPGKESVSNNENLMQLCLF